MALGEKYKEVIGKVADKNGVDVGVGLDMVISDYHQKKMGGTTKYVTDWSDEQWEEFGKDYEEVVKFELGF